MTKAELLKSTCEEKIKLSEPLEKTLNNIVIPYKRTNLELVNVNVKKFDKEWSKDTEFYIGKNGKGQIHNRYQDFIEFLTTDPEVRGPIEASEVHVNEFGKPGFVNGRHRFAVLRDLGAKTIPVAMISEGVINAKKFGFLY